MSIFVTESFCKEIPIIPICQEDFAIWQLSQPTPIKNIVASNKFMAKPDTFCLLTDTNGNLEKVFLGMRDKNDLFAFGLLPRVLPAGCYYINAQNFSPIQLEQAAIGWGMGSYQFSRYKATKEFPAKLLCKEQYDINRLTREINSIFLVRDLINIPASDLYPEKLAAVATLLAKEFSAEIKIIKGDELASGFPAVYAVGGGSKKEPMLIDIRYGELNAPKIALVGKGVCFDSGGLQLKTSSGMLLMKKDMAGAAHVLGLARMIMEARLPVNLRVVIPAVENLISGDSLKPGDIIKTRKGSTIEVANTDAEGRLILSDALAYACEWQPNLVIDFATLTSAARVALGPDITALFASSDRLAQEINTWLIAKQEPAWPMPLYQPYVEFLKSEMADFKNIASSDTIGGGAIIAALVLQQFVAQKIAWVHFDINAYNAVAKSGRPEGGEACCLRGVFAYIEQLVSK